MLLIDSDRDVVDVLRSHLVARDFSVLVSATGADAIELLDREEPDVALVDLTLPCGDGLELCRTMRARSPLGIIVVSARHGENDKVRALNLGADDYVTKPFGVEELVARINATLRRSRPARAGDDAAAVVEVGDVVIDLDAHVVRLADEPVHLTPTEFALLRELVVESPKIVSHGQLLRRVWGPGYSTATEYTRVYVRRLRTKLEPAGSPRLIVTEPRVGYRFIG